MTVRYYDELPNKPLVEAYVEIKWGRPNEPDPAYPIMVGRLYDRVRERFGKMVDLPIVQVPASMTVHAVRHQFCAPGGGRLSRLAQASRRLTRQPATLGRLSVKVPLSFARR